MYRTARLTSVGFTFLCLFLAASIEAGETPPPDLSGKVQQAFCYSSHNQYNEPAMYFSDVFQIRVPQSAGIWYSNDMAKTFVAYLKQQHGYVDTQYQTVFCALHDTVQMTQGVKNSLAADHRNHKQTIVETGWKMTAQQAEAAVGAAAKPAASAAAKPNPAVTIHGYCIGNEGGQGKTYFSAAFSVPREVPVEVNVVDKNRPTAERWEKSFNAYLTQDHGFKGTVACFGVDTLAGAQLNWDRQHRMAQGISRGRVVETGWTYKSN